LQRSSQAAARMQALIDDLLVLSRLGAQPLRVASVALDPLIDRVLSDLDARIEASQAQIQRDPLPTIEGDATQLQQLFQNLLANALKFHAPDRPPQVRVHAAPAQLANQIAAIEIRIEDNGIGFDPAEAERIFAPFRRLHGRDRFEGTGMGLAIVKRIVEAHSGQISASATPDQGACFRVVLPLGQSQ
ncbi:MAG: ATP-binding protein, partial [Lysobacterales bacterium]